MIELSYSFVIQSSLTESFIEGFVGLSVSKVENYDLVSEELSSTQVTKQLFTVTEPNVVSLVKRHINGRNELTYSSVCLLEQEILNSINMFTVNEQIEAQLLLDETPELLKAAAIIEQKLLFIEQ